MTIRNRLVKVAMYEHLADFRGGPPNQLHFCLYSKWAGFNWGMIITGNVQVSNNHLTLGRDICLPRDLSEESLLPFREWNTSIRGSGESKALAVMQLSHAGLAFQKPKQMTLEDIDDVVRAFVKGAKVASESGFDGVQIHAAHGFHIPNCKSNERLDEYSSQPHNALRLLHRIVSSIRAVVKKEFIIGIKINAADYVDTLEDDRVLGHFQSIATWGNVDFIEVSGGDYEKPADFRTLRDFMAKMSKSPRQALFSRFSKTAMDTLESLQTESSLAKPLILLTGGLRTPELLHIALEKRHAHLLGIGRGSILSPDLPRLLECELNKAQASSSLAWSAPFRREPDLSVSLALRNIFTTIPLIGAGTGMAWYLVTMRRLAMNPSRPFKSKDLEPDYTLGALAAVFWMWCWVDSPFVSAATYVVFKKQIPEESAKLPPPTMLATTLITLALASFTYAAPSVKVSGCDISKATIEFPAGQTALAPPTSTPSFVAAAIGTQNYTCSAAGTYTNVGAVAELFDISCLYNTPAFSKIADVAFTAWKAAPASLSTQKVISLLEPIPFPVILGQHYFVPNPVTGTGLSPKWDFIAQGATKGNPKAFVVGAKVNGLPAPTGAQDIDWVQLKSLTGSLATQIYRVDTRGGQPPASVSFGV
ncbi:hypothetical protein H0H81_005229 [Sphagnurus paluster]|uniref:NADH:flavin oxidoreductase/NADH oxidase N-terminal domain-containing protein n=1 Tax=Sphagnurus paluster TaxID=117069 RepID=A0A9P7GKN1_9AGAR|nr:hypothetical protein H0H81_005229 [Sphagnurus paluster]